MKGISALSIPEYRFSSYRHFESGECHVSRICEDDVIIMVFDGILRFCENGIPKEVAKGEYYIQERGIYQSANMPSDSPSYYYVHAGCAIVDDDSPYLAIKGKFDRVEILKYIKLLEESRNNPKMLIDRQAAFLGMLSVLSKGTDEDTSVASEIAGYLNGNISKRILLDDLCVRFGYCKNYINALFKKKYGLTVHEYITETRVGLAKNLLLTSSLTVDEISLSVGFESYINLYKAFKKKVGMSPSEFRNSIN